MTHLERECRGQRVRYEIASIMGAVLELMRETLAGLRTTWRKTHVTRQDQ